MLQHSQRDAAAKIHASHADPASDMNNMHPPPNFSTNQNPTKENFLYDLEPAAYFCGAYWNPERNWTECSIISQLFAKKFQFRVSDT